MHSVDLNYGAIVLAAIVPMIVGTIWYMPRVFGGRWMRLLGITDSGMSPGPAMVKAFLAAVITAVALAVVISWSGASNALEGGAIGALLWLGFVGTSSGMEVFFVRRPWALWAINNGDQLVALAISGAILGAWR